ncbi:MAG: DNA-protecting protein DprA [Bacillaceae bacterium]|nr:DNA-protecting protein DprA [Bacillaceae bacterium]
MQTRDYLIAIHHVDGIGSRIIRKIVDGRPDIETLKGSGPEKIKALMNIKIEVAQKVAESLNPRMVHRIQNNLEDKKISAVTLLDPEYPAWLSQIDDPPPILYGKGDFSFLNLPMIGIVGTRRPTSYGKIVANKLAQKIVRQGWVVVSGMAEGIDEEAHRGALAARNKHATVAVLGGGVDIVYPSRNRKLYEEIIKSGLVLSEFSPGTQPRKGLFPVRNRIISGLSRGVVVVEAAARSGSLITADAALEQGRDVFAVPGPVLSAKSTGPNRLIQQGAKLIAEANDIFVEYPGVHVEHNDNQDDLGDSDDRVTDEERLLLEVIQYTQIHIDDIIRCSGLNPAQVHKALISLQVKRKIRQLPGSFYVNIT